MPTDPIGALIAAGQGATPGPVEWAVDRTSGRGCLALQTTEGQTRILAIPLGCLVDGYRPYDDDRAYIAAAYDPRLLPALAALTAERDALEAALHKATVCDCGEELSRGLCRICDNDE